jgi:ribosomal-protein-alanine N-acetyltransferase
LSPARPDLRIRRCTRTDLGAVLEIEERSFPDPYDREIFEQLLRSEPECFLVAEVQGAVLGYVAASARYGMVFSLAVSARHRRRGIGRSLMDKVLAQVLAHAERVILQVRASNTGAQELYRDLGFRAEGIVKRYYPGGEDALVMSLGRPT